MKNSLESPDINRSTGTKDKSRIEQLEKALTEIIERSSMLIYQNTGRWNIEKEHDMRSLHVTEGNIRIAKSALRDDKFFEIV